jgi:hypothetical protein
MPVGHLAIPPARLLGFFAADIERAPRSIRAQPVAAYCWQDPRVIDKERHSAMFDTDLPTLPVPQIVRRMAHRIMRPLVAPVGTLGHITGAANWCSSTRAQPN